MVEQIGKVVHCVGIGGIGLSGLARFLHASGRTVSGSDLQDSIMIQTLRKEGIKVRIGPHAPILVPANAELVIHTTATQRTNPEIVEATRRGIPVCSYAEALARFFAGHRVVAVSGTHGKSTTTGLIGWTLEQLHADPSVLVGAQIASWGGNIRKGNSDIAVIEADEFAKNFLEYSPYVAVVTNVDYDHIETYRGFEDVLSAFMQFIQQVREDGIVVIPGDEHYTDALRESAGSRMLVTYGASAGDISLLNTTLRLRIHGSHNMRNALAAYAACTALGYAPEDVQKALKSFPGLWRRFEEIGTLKEARVFSDYAHHPRELQAVLTTARELFPKKRLVVLFQPHHAERLKHFLAEFARELSRADDIFLADVYHVFGREGEEQSVTSETLADALRTIGVTVQGIGPVKELLPQIRARIDHTSVLFCIGAGDIDAEVREYLTQAYVH